MSTKRFSPLVCFSHLVAGAVAGCAEKGVRGWVKGAKMVATGALGEIGPEGRRCGWGAERVEWGGEGERGGDERGALAAPHGPIWGLCSMCGWGWWNAENPAVCSLSGWDGSPLRTSVAGGGRSEYESCVFSSWPG